MNTLINETKNDYSEKTLTANTVFDGKVIKVEVVNVELPNGKEATREIVHHQGAVGILAISKENKIILVRQYRKALDKTILEIPAGKLEPNEEPMECAYRELKEETGYLATNMRQITKFYTSPGFADEIIYLYEASRLELGEVDLDDDEFVDIEEYSYQETLDLIDKDQIIDAKTLVALYYWQIRQLEGK